LPATASQVVQLLADAGLTGHALALVAAVARDAAIAAADVGRVVGAGLADGRAGVADTAAAVGLARPVLQMRWR
jgi:hypothetical protein